MLATIKLVQVPLAISRAPGHQLGRWKPSPVMSSPETRHEMGQFAGVAAFGALGLLLAAAIGAGTAWVGFSTGKREKGFLSILGYGVGSLGALGALGGTIGALLWVAGVSLASSAVDEAKQRAAEFQQRASQPLPPIASGLTTPTEFPTTPSFQ